MRLPANFGVLLVNFHSRHVIPALLSAAILAVAGCGKGDDKKATQVAAKVNGDEVTVHQLNNAMQRLGNIPEAQAKQTQKQVLDRLVDQQLLVQQAIEKKLDRDPRVLAGIEAARRQILAQSYVEQVMGTAQKSNAEQVKEFYDKHPELFRERRVYRFTQVAIAAPADVQPKIRAKLEELDKLSDKTKVLPQLAEWLKAQSIQFRAQQATQAAEQLPLEALPKYQQMKVGDLLFIPQAQGVVVSQLTAAQTQPLNEQQAQPFIEQFLQNREKLKLSEEEMKRLRAAAKIEYIGEFAKLTQDQTPQPTKPEPAAVAPQSTENSKDDLIQKGMQGLKK
jgi:EpsD family peptidyl-prolyl cis-trans isomerase